MPFTDPLLPIVLIAMMIALIMPVCLHLVKEWKARDGESGNRKTECSNANHQYIDLFSGALAPLPVDDTQVKITTKFVSFGSGTEELAFDWIVAPFEFTTEAAPPAGDKSSNQPPDSKSPARDSEN